MQEKTKYQLITPKKSLRYAGLLFILFIMLASNSFGQSITWQRMYNGSDGGIDGGFSVCNADGENLYICGLTTVLPNSKYLFLLKLNPFGEIIWTRSVTTVQNSYITEGRTIIPDGNGGCVITGVSSYTFTVSFNQNGDTLWNKDYGLQDKQLYDIIKTSDGGYIACGRDYEGVNDDAFVLKIDSLGNLQWQKTYYSTRWKNFECIQETNNNDGFIACGFNYSYPGDSIRGVVFKVNSNGDSLWEKRFDYQTAGIIYSIEKTGSGYLLGGNNFSVNPARNNVIFRLDEIGNITYLKTIQSVNYREYFGKLKIINPNKYVIASTRESLNSYDGHAITTDSMGNIISEKIYPSPDMLFLRSVLPLPNGDIVFAGEVDFDSVFSRNDVYALRTDSLLNAPPPIGIQAQNTDLSKQFALYQNFPNPFNPATTITYNLYKAEDVQLILYNVSGQETKILLNERKNAGAHNFKLATDKFNLSSGVYFVRMLTSSGFSQTIKIILLK